MDASDLRQRAFEKRAEAARARAYLTLVTGDRERLLAYIAELESEAERLERQVAED